VYGYLLYMYQDRNVNGSFKYQSVPYIVELKMTIPMYLADSNPHRFGAQDPDLHLSESRTRLRICIKVKSRWLYQARMQSNGGSHLRAKDGGYPGTVEGLKVFSFLRYIARGLIYLKVYVSVADLHHLSGSAS
jgi:hypothetical protein